MVGNIYEHYKGKRYKVLAIATLSEDINKQFVVYETLYDNPVSKTWARPLPMFLETVNVNGKQVPRFRLVDN